ncbi:MAG TPA: hypothetical protein VF867_06650 [Arthrobacter sp.]
MADHIATSVVGDALERAWRTLWQGFLVDGLAAAGTGLVLLLTDADLSSPVFWNLAGLMVAKSLAVSFASFLARLKSTPVNAPVG